MKNNTIYTCFLVILFALGGFKNSWAGIATQKAKVDSLTSALSHELSDSSRVDLLIELCNEYRTWQPDSAIFFGDKALILAGKINYSRGMAYGLTKVGTVHSGLGNFNKALAFQYRSLKKFEEINDQKGVAISLINIGSIYYYQNNHPKAIDYYTRALNVSKKEGFSRGIADAYSGFGIVFSYRGSYLKALDYFKQSLAIREQILDKQGVAQCYNNIANIYSMMGNNQYVLEYYLKALIIKEEIGDKLGIAIALNNIGGMYNDLGKTQLAIDYSSKALKVAQEVQAAPYMRDAYYYLADAHSDLGNYEQAYKYHTLYSDIKDSLFNLDKHKQLLTIQTDYETERKENEIKLLNKDKELRDFELDKEKDLRYLLIAAIVFIGFIGSVLYNRFRLKSRILNILKKQNLEITTKNVLIEAQQKEITDSLLSASAIQYAMLPQKHIFNDLVKDSFIILKPCNIVSGDFYWYHKDENSLIVAAVDCTGHGVPGAFMSILGNTLLNDIVIEEGVLQPGKILEELDKRVIRSLKKSADSIDRNEGMDVCIAKIDLHTNEMISAGAFRDIYVIRKKELIEIKGNRYPIGGLVLEENRTFNDNYFKLQSNDKIYLSSDGLSSQFGGSKGKKLMNKNFKELILSIENQSMAEQEKYLKNFINSWKGEHEQVDDILVIGIQIS